MRLALVTNDIGDLGDQFTTTRLAWAAERRGHAAFLINVGDLRYDADERLRARGRRYAESAADRPEWLAALRNAPAEDLCVEDLDVVLLRENPGRDFRPWAASAALTFGRLAAERGVIVLNDPVGLTRAASKLYLQEFPPSVRPRTLITRDRSLLREFADREPGPTVLKPLVGSGGRDVFIAKKEDRANFNQIVDVIARDGFVIAQEYLPRAEHGDLRLILVNGEPFRYRDRLAAFQRVRVGGDLRSNLSAGGGLARAEITDTTLAVAAQCRARLVEDGMFIAGLDIVGDKIMEINVHSPGGLGSAQRFEKVDFAEGVIEAIERKVAVSRGYGRRVANAVLAVI